MYDALRTRYTFACPNRGEVGIRLSAFRRVERLPGAVHPALFRISFACPCGGEHPGLVAHDELDWAPLGLRAGSFVNLMTDRLDNVAAELSDVAARRIAQGEWPWSFFCYPEERPRPIFPSSFFLLAASGRGAPIGVAVRCPACASVSVNLVSAEHVDVPFFSDAEIGVVEHVFHSDADTLLERFREELYSARFDTRRVELR
jgi:hypothetical protein